MTVLTIAGGAATAGRGLAVLGAIIVAEWQTVHIQLGNFIFGRAHLLDLVLPPAWQLERGFSHPEIHATHTRRGTMWVVAGDAWYLLRHPEHDWLLEFHLQVRARPYARPREARSVQVMGHAGWWRPLRLRRGLPWRWRITPGLEVAWFCPLSERGFRLRALGRVPDEALAALRTAWTRSHCHRPPSSNDDAAAFDGPDSF